ncbi:MULTISPECIES: divalent-cation tolerance protein CutA [unclassified Meiothermus]|uniref:divalent-cation tolerance protein CutA n=1 Tax=unclassified Meiothermus TaxID=370471 RepID=UPI000D7BDA78|nr:MULTISPECIES: divalent-cation tolerance protein CutA [unclassified Meiothermus]PZA06473.1 divalent-cation tolerance protein CutA [Meiothermus sp. Pnk-1]RYM36260.1 divalent-cation tolerance protein CutA [Meiothermus sp. PNK-Is4]
MSLVVLVTVPDLETARHIGRTLVEEQLAACANIIPGLVSIYRWEGEINEDPELLLLLKTRPERYEELEGRVKQLHPYTLPEIIALPIQHGSIDYLRWIAKSLALE